MNNSSKPVKTDLTLSGRLSSADFSELPYDEKMLHLMSVSAGRRLELIIDATDGKQLVRGLSPQDFYLTVKEIGETDVAQLLLHSSAEQLAFTLDLELWGKWEFINERAITWLDYLLSAGEPDAMTLLSQLDPELLQLILLDEISVGGGTGDLATDSERLDEWDHSFDSIYYITFRNDKHTRLIGTLLDVIFRHDRELYLDLMEGCRSAVRIEIEDMCYQFRSGRLADLGFPSYEQAIEIYSPLAPDAVTLSEEKLPLVNDVGDVVTATLPIDDDTFVSRMFSSEMTESLRQELGELLNSAMVAEGGSGIDEDTARSVHKRVYGWLNLSLEHLCGSDESAASRVIRHEPLKTLFRRGCSIVRQLAHQAKTVTSDDYATGKVLRGLAADRPLYYRGLDTDRVDGYREFRTISDVRLAQAFLDRLKR